MEEDVEGHRHVFYIFLSYFGTWGAGWGEELFFVESKLGCTKVSAL